MATEEQNVYITGHGLADWSTEATQAQIAGSLKQVQHDNNVMLQFLGKIAQKMSINVKELNAVKAEIQKNTQSEKVASDKSEAQATAETRYQVQGNQYLKAKMMVNKDILGAIQDQSRQQAKEVAMTAALIGQGIDKDVAKKVAGESTSQSRHDMKKQRLVDWAATAALISKSMNDALNTQFGERVTFTNQMRQSGLLAGMDMAAAGMLKMTEAVSTATFTLGEAAEFVKLFSETVGVKGVKETLNFVNKMANADSPDGWMQRLGMDFGQIADLSGEYLDTLQRSGQLRDRTDDQLAAGMEDFMDNVMVTSNVLKISMTEAAELMKNALDDRKLGFLATMGGDKGEKLRATLSSLDVSLKSTFGDALGMRLQMGNQQAFTYSQEFQELNRTPLGRELLQFIEQASGVYEDKGGESFHAFMSEEYGGFTDSLIKFMENDALRAMSAHGSPQIEWLGEMLPKKELMSDANAGMPAPSEAIITELLSLEAKRTAANLSETAINTLMEAQIDNIQMLTESQRGVAEEMAATLEKYGVIPSGFAQAWTMVKTVGLDILAWGLRSGFTNDAATIRTKANKENQVIFGQLEGIEKTIFQNQESVKPYLDKYIKQLADESLGKAIKDEAANKLADLSEKRIRELEKRLYEYEQLLIKAIDENGKDSATAKAIRKSTQTTELLLQQFRGMITLK